MVVWGRGKEVHSFWRDLSGGDRGFAVLKIFLHSRLAVAWTAKNRGSRAKNVNFLNGPKIVSE